jgi:hypothetical protein
LFPSDKDFTSKRKANRSQKDAVESAHEEIARQSEELAGRHFENSDLLAKLEAALHKLKSVSYPSDTIHCTPQPQQP